MKVILLEDVKKLGKKGEVIEISDGYARNFVIHKKLGIEGTSKNLNDLKLQKINDKRIAEEVLQNALDYKNELEEKTITLKMKAGGGGKVFGSVSSKEIVKEFMEQENLELDKKKIQLKEPIKAFGTYEIDIKLHPDVTATLNVKVIEA